jgi:hypothetical protein
MIEEKNSPAEQEKQHPERCVAKQKMYEAASFGQESVSVFHPDVPINNICVSKRVSVFERIEDSLKLTLW